MPEPSSTFSYHYLLITTKLAFITEFELLPLYSAIMLAFSFKMPVRLAYSNFTLRPTVKLNYLLRWRFELASAFGFGKSNHPKDSEQFELELVIRLTNCYRQRMPSFRLTFSSKSIIPTSHFTTMPTSSSASLLDQPKKELSELEPELAVDYHSLRRVSSLFTNLVHPLKLSEEYRRSKEL